MQLNNKQISILLIFLIGLSNISCTSLSIKSNRVRSHSHSKKVQIKTTMSSKQAAESIFAKLKTEVTDPAKIAFFTMGLLSNWLPKMENLYQKIKGLTAFFKPCYKTIKSVWEMVHGTSTEDDPSKKAEHDEDQAKTQEELTKEENKIAEIETKEISDKDKKKLCTKTKEKVDDVWKKTIDYMFKQKSKNEKESVIRGSDSWEAKRYCEYVTKFATEDKANKAWKLLKKNFEGPEDFLDICMKIRETPDCDQFQPDNKGALHFIKKSLKYAMFVKNGASCIINLVKGGGEDTDSGTPKNQEIANLADTATGTWAVTKLVFQELGAFILHVITFGIFGALRAAWNIIKLTLKIFILVTRWVHDIPYNIGQLVGLAIKSLKALAFGRRRRR